MCQSHRSWKAFIEAVEITPRKCISERILPVPRLQEENAEVIQRSVEGIVPQEHSDFVEDCGKSIAKDENPESALSKYFRDQNSISEEQEELT